MMNNTTLTQFLIQNFLATDLFNALSANFTKWSNTIKQLVGKLATNCLSEFNHFGGLALKGLIFRTARHLNEVALSIF